MCSHSPLMTRESLITACRHRKKMETVIVFDIETTGLYPHRGDKILEIAAIPIIDNEIRIEDAFERLVNPGKKIPEHITKINNITDDMVKDAGSIDTVLPEFLLFIDLYPLVAHNARFDISFIQYYARKLGLPPLQNRVYDTLDLSKKLFPEHVYHNLTTVLERLGIPYKRDERHRSLEDTRLTAEAFIKIMRLLSERAASG
jgi:DNA polymerase III epsilon subunit family exonuclease